MIQVLLLVAVASFILPAEGHVALTFPPAREYDLDFLDTLRSVEQVFIKVKHQVFINKYVAFLPVCFKFINLNLTQLLSHYIYNWMYEEPSKSFSMLI